MASSATPVYIRPARSQLQFHTSDASAASGSQVSAAFASILAITHPAGLVFEAVAVLGVLAVDLLTGQVVARMDKRERNKLAKAA